uniref:Uncharacterized protein ycf20 n=1 Tax=Asparagopsis taxiformis TaxID=260499 RepID=A0A1C9CC53_9FLOR|nr:hypothetical protein Aspa_073 [Asparagopsis taxiformis]AOM65952.1 hypothetical protein Aspa_073 [Asparagopsis taxiformis]
MKHTNFQLSIILIQKYINKVKNYKLHYLNIKLICFLLGFFIATTLSTIPAQTDDWGVIAASIIVSIIEITSKIIYQNFKYHSINLSNFNYIKIGIIYGLFVDAFKLGS